jgi:hypothetical protein
MQGMPKLTAALPAAVTLAALVATASPAAAQQAGQDRTTIGGAQGSQAFSVRGKVTLFAGPGLDLDVLGNVTAGGIGQIRGTQTLIEDTAYPDVYVKTQRRVSGGISIGIFKKTELVVRYQEAKNPASTVLIGAFGTNDNRFPVRIDDYHDRMVEFGMRRYFATPRRSRQYWTLLFGYKQVDAIGMDMQAPGGTVRANLYSQSRVPSIGLEFGVTLEFLGHAGLYLESGARWQKKLKRDDTDLAMYDLQLLNDTGSRLFMPATLGVLIRF